MADNYGIGAFNTFDFISNKTCYKACGYTDDDMLIANNTPAEAK